MVLPQAVSLIEWAERMGSLAPHHRLDIRISIVDDAQREALLAAISAKGLRSKVGEIADVEGEELEAYDDVRWRLIELLPHGARWEGIVGALRGHVTARGADFGLAVAPKIA